MKAVIIQKPGEIRMVELPKPVPGPGDVVSRVVYSGICGTDLAILKGDVSFVKDGTAEYPVKIGHEWSGVVESVGPGVARFKPGDRVVSDNGVSCGVCERCLAGDFYRCGSGRSLGTINTWDYGSFAEYILMPERHMFHLDDSISFEQGALIEPSTIGLAGLLAVNAGKGDAVLVTGTGAVGLSAAAMAKSLGAAKVIVAGRKQSKLDIGLKIGADAAVNMEEEDMARAVLRETGGRGVNKIIEASGAAGVLDKALDCAGHGCEAALLGFYEGHFGGGFNIDRIVLKNLVIKGVTGNPCVPRVMGLMAGGAIDLAPLVTHIFPIEKSAEAFTEAAEKGGGKIKMLVKMTSG